MVKSKKSTSEEIIDQYVEDDIKDDHDDDPDDDPEEEDDDTIDTEDDDEEDDDDDQNSDINIDLTNNDIYKALCTLLEDQDGNNILDYLNIIKDDIHELTKGVKSYKKDIGRIADSLEKGVSLMAAYIQTVKHSGESSSKEKRRVKD